MTLKRQLLLVSLLILVLPWAGCEFMRETETALRKTQQQMLSSTASAIADSLSQYVEAFPPARSPDFRIGEQLYAHPLDGTPLVDGYLDDWPLPPETQRTLTGRDGPIRYVLGADPQALYLYVDVTDRAVIYGDRAALVAESGPPYADRVRLVSANPPYLEETLTFAAEAPGPLVTYIENNRGFAPEPTVRAHWQDVPGGYRVEARIPLNLLGTHIGLLVDNTDDPRERPVTAATFSARSPGPLAGPSAELDAIAANLAQPGMRLIVTDAAGFRLASAGDLAPAESAGLRGASNWLRIAYNALVEPGEAAAFAEPSPDGRETQPYVRSALGGSREAAWFRGDESGRAIVAVAAPVVTGSETIGAVLVQQGTDAILSLRNASLVRLMNVTLFAMAVVALVLLGYATWLSRRIRRLSIAAESALETDSLSGRLPSADSGDEIGDLSRSFSSVLSRLGEYNEYLRTLASKLSHELRTPLAIVTSSLENLEHEPLGESARRYTARARDGSERLRRILAAMSEASRVEELMKSADSEVFDLARVVEPAVAAYGDIYPARRFSFARDDNALCIAGSPELLVQMLDKLVDNAVGFSGEGHDITIRLAASGADARIDVDNPGPPLPERMQRRLFDSMVSLRAGDDGRHLGLGLYIARLIAEGHDGRIEAHNIDGGVRFSVWLPRVSTGIRAGD